MFCRAEADGTLDGGETEGNEDDKAKRVCRGVVVFSDGVFLRSCPSVIF